MDEQTMRQNIYITVALICEGVSEVDLSRAFLCVIQNGDARPMGLPEPLASLFTENGRMHEETKQAFVVYVNRHFETA